jgi:hypothetical protein
MATTLQPTTESPRGVSTQGTLRIVATNSAYGAMCQACIREMPPAARRRAEVFAFRSWREVDWSELKPGQSVKTLVLCRLADIPEDVEAVRLPRGTCTLLVFVEEMPVEAIPSRVPRLNVRDSRRLHIARQGDSDAILAIIRRVIRGLAATQGEDRIVDAWVEGAALVVLSPSFERLYVPVKDLEQFLGSKAERASAFEIDEDGSYLYWPHADVHLGWEQLRGIVDPTTLLATRQKSNAFNQRYGAAIRALREDRGLTQSDIAGVADRHLRRIEHGKLAATSSVLRALAESHEMSLAVYLAELAERL